jgi:hypothetical protein
MTFAEASKKLFSGKKIKRKGWVESVLFMPPRVSFDGPDPVNVAGYYILCMPNRQWFPGWVPSQSDLLSDDWTVE